MHKQTYVRIKDPKLELYYPQGKLNADKNQIKS